MGIKERYAAKKLLKKEATIKRNPQIPDINSIKKVGIIWQPQQKDAFQYLQDYFSKKQAIVRGLCFHAENTTMASGMNSVTPKELNWCGFPKPGTVDNFFEIPFDLLLNIVLDQNITIDYITLVTNARFKIGWSPKAKNYFDLNINIGQNQDALFLAKQQIFYLAKLNNKSGT